MWPANGSMVNLPKEQSTKRQLGKFKGSYTHGGREELPRQTQTSTTLRSTSTENTTKRQTTQLISQAQRKRKYDVYRKDVPTTWKAIRGFWDGSFKDNGKSDCGIVIKGVDRGKWVTLRVGASMAAEVLGVCVLTSVLDLILCKSLSVQNIIQRINQMLHS